MARWVVTSVLGQPCSYCSRIAYAVHDLANHRHPTCVLGPEQEEQGWTDAGRHHDLQTRRHFRRPTRVPTLAPIPALA